MYICLRRGLTDWKWQREILQQREIDRCTDGKTLYKCERKNKKPQNDHIHLIYRSQLKDDKCKTRDQ